MTGILLHVYHLEARNWEELVWGDPVHDKLGVGTKFIQLLLTIPMAEQVSAIVYSGPSQKDGLGEGAYIKQFLTARLEKLCDFPSLQRRIDALSADEYNVFVSRLQNLVLGPILKNTQEEVINANKHFSELEPTQIVQVAAASHAPRCLLAQVKARHQGLLTGSWFVAASDVCFAGTTPDDVVILEPPHRGDDPMIDIQPSLPEIIKPFFALPPDQKKEFASRIANATSNI